MNILTHVEVTLKWKPKTKFRLRRWFKSPVDVCEDIWVNGVHLEMWTGSLGGFNSASIYCSPAEIALVQARNTKSSVAEARDLTNS
jgi:hypothetical protein